ncbi:MAG: hypothetical protein ABJF01_06060 [bacterium]
MTPRQKAGWAAAIAMSIGGAACSNQARPMDEGLKHDLAAARVAPAANLTISPLELGQRAVPGVAKRAPRPVARVAEKPAPMLTPTAAQVAAVVEAPATAQAPEPSRRAEPTQTRPAATARQADDSRHGPYKTEAEIFRQMPWIRP